MLPFILKGQHRITKAEGKAGSIATEAFASIRMVTSCGAEARVAEKYSEWVKKAKQAEQATAPLFATQFGLVFFGLYGTFALSFWYGMKSLLAGRVDDIGTVVIVLFSVMMMVISLERVSTPLIAISKAMVAAAEFFSVIDAPQPKVGSLKEPEVSATEDIVFEDVHFAYPSRPSKKVLDGLNLRIQAHKNTAIVGPMQKLLERIKRNRRRMVKRPRKGNMTATRRTLWFLPLVLLLQSTTWKTRVLPWNYQAPSRPAATRWMR